MSGASVGAPRRVAAGASVVAALVLAVLVWMLAAASGGSDPVAESPLLGQPAPEVRTTTIDDEPFDLSRRKGSWVLLNFFNSTCVPCREEHGDLVAFAESQEGADDPVELYSVVVDDTDAAVRAFFDELGGAWPKLRDPDGATTVAFGVAQVPETWVVDPNGVVRLRVAGRVTLDILRSEIAVLRGEA